MWRYFEELRLRTRRLLTADLNDSVSSHVVIRVRRFGVMRAGGRKRRAVSLLLLLLLKFCHSRRKHVNIKPADVHFNTGWLLTRLPPPEWFSIFWFSKQSRRNIMAQKETPGWNLPPPAISCLFYSSGGFYHKHDEAPITDRKWCFHSNQSANHDDFDPWSIFSTEADWSHKWKDLRCHTEEKRSSGLLLLSFQRNVSTWCFYFYHIISLDSWKLWCHWSTESAD